MFDFLKLGMVAVPRLKPSDFHKDMEFLNTLIEEKFAEQLLIIAADFSTNDTLINDKKMNAYTTRLTTIVLSSISNNYLNDVMLLYFNWNGFLNFISGKILTKISTACLELNKTRIY
jgi:hypothetical protein